MTNIAKINSREKKIYNLILSLLLSVAIALTSCESRDDYIFASFHFNFRNRCTIIVDF